MKLIVISTLALSLTALGARAQQQGSDPNAINQGSHPSGTPPAPVIPEDKALANLPQNGDKATADPNEAADAATPAKPALKTQGRSGQARTGSRMRHHSGATSAAPADKGSVDSVARPAAPSPTDDTQSGRARAPGDATGTPESPAKVTPDGTDTQKPIETNPSPAPNEPPQNK